MRTTKQNAVVMAVAVIITFAATAVAGVSFDYGRLCNDLAHRHHLGPVPPQFGGNCPGGITCNGCDGFTPYGPFFCDYTQPFCQTFECGNGIIDGEYPEQCDSNTLCTLCACDAGAIPTVPLSTICCPETIPASQFRPQSLTPFSGSTQDAQFVASNMRAGAGAVAIAVPIRHWVGPTDTQYFQLTAAVCGRGSRCSSATVSFTFHVWIGTEDPTITSVDLKLTSYSTVYASQLMWSTRIDIRRNARYTWSTIAVSIPMRVLMWGQMPNTLSHRIITGQLRTPTASDLLPSQNVFTFSGLSKICFAVSGVEYTGIQQLMPPLLLIHGILASEDTWATWANWLTYQAGSSAGGWLFYAMKWDYGHAVDSIPVLARMIHSLQSAWLIQHVAIVAHSKGGLLTRAYLGDSHTFGSLAGSVKGIIRDNEYKVDRASRFTVGVWQVQQLATPNCGTPFADIGLPVAEVLAHLCPGLYKAICELVVETLKPIVEDMTVGYMTEHFLDEFGPNCNVEISIRGGDNDFLVPHNLHPFSDDGESSFYCNALAPHVRRWPDFTEHDHTSLLMIQHLYIHEVRAVFDQTTQDIWNAYYSGGDLSAARSPADVFSSFCPAQTAASNRKPLAAEDDATPTLIASYAIAVGGSTPPYYATATIAVAACEQLRVSILASQEFAFTVQIGPAAAGGSTFTALNTTAVRASSDGTLTTADALISASQALCGASLTSGQCFRYDLMITRSSLLAALPANLNVSFIPSFPLPPPNGDVNTNLTLRVDASGVVPDVLVVLTPTALVRVGQSVQINATVNYRDSNPALSAAPSDIVFRVYWVNGPGNFTQYVLSHVGGSNALTFQSNITVPTQGTACGQRVQLAVRGTSTNPLKPWTLTRTVSVPVACTTTQFEPAAFIGTGSGGRGLWFALANDTNGDGASDGVWVTVSIVVDPRDIQSNATFLANGVFVVGGLNVVSGHTTIQIGGPDATATAVVGPDGVTRVNASFLIDASAIECYTATCCSTPVDIAITRLELVSYDPSGVATAQDSMTLYRTAPLSSGALFNRCSFRSSVLVVTAFASVAIPSVLFPALFDRLQITADAFVARRLFYTDASFSTPTNISVCADVSASGSALPFVTDACIELYQHATEYQSNLMFTISGDAIRSSARDGPYWIHLRLSTDVLSRPDVQMDPTYNLFNTSANYRFQQFGALPVVTSTLRPGSIRSLHALPQIDAIGLSGDLQTVAFGLWSVSNASFISDFDPATQAISNALIASTVVAMTVPPHNASSNSSGDQPLFWLGGSFTLTTGNATQLNRIASPLLVCRSDQPQNNTSCYTIDCAPPAVMIAAGGGDALFPVPLGDVRSVRIDPTETVACMTGDFLVSAHVSFYYATPSLAPDFNDTAGANGTSIRDVSTPLYCLFLTNETAFASQLARATAVLAIQTPPPEPVSPLLVIPGNARTDCAVDAIAFDAGCDHIDIDDDDGSSNSGGGSVNLTRRLYASQSCAFSVSSCDLVDSGGCLAGDQSVVFRFDSGQITTIHSVVDPAQCVSCANDTVQASFASTYFGALVMPRAPLLLAGNFRNSGFGLKQIAYFDCIHSVWRSPVTIPDGAIWAVTEPARAGGSASENDQFVYVAGAFTFLDETDSVSGGGDSSTPSYCRGVARLNLTDLTWRCVAAVTILSGVVSDIVYIPHTNQLWLTGDDDLLLYRNDTTQYYSRFGVVPGLEPPSPPPQSLSPHALSRCADTTGTAPPAASDVVTPSSSSTGAAGGGGSARSSSTGSSAGGGGVQSSSSTASPHPAASGVSSSSGGSGGGGGALSSSSAGASAPGGGGSSSSGSASAQDSSTAAAEPAIATADSSSAAADGGSGSGHGGGGSTEASTAAAGGGGDGGFTSSGTPPPRAATGPGLFAAVCIVVWAAVAVSTGY